jgi:hypothetical protein
LAVLGGIGEQWLFCGYLKGRFSTPELHCRLQMGNFPGTFSSSLHEKRKKLKESKVWVEIWRISFREAG